MPRYKLCTWVCVCVCIILKWFSLAQFPMSYFKWGVFWSLHHRCKVFPVFPLISVQPLCKSLLIFFSSFESWFSPTSIAIPLSLRKGYVNWDCFSFYPHSSPPLNQMRSKLSVNQTETSFLDLQIHSTNEAISSLLALRWGQWHGRGILSSHGGPERRC